MVQLNIVAGVICSYRLAERNQLCSVDRTAGPPNELAGEYDAGLHRGAGCRNMQSSTHRPPAAVHVCRIEHVNQNPLIHGKSVQREAVHTGMVLNCISEQ
jgi:hypothetical protein